MEEINIQEFFEKFFQINKNEFDLKFDDKFLYDEYNLSTLKRILKVLSGHLEYFADNTPVENKRRAGFLLLKHDMRSFVENDRAEVIYRLRELFKATTEKNINIYNILYSTVLTDANLNSYFDGFSKEKIVLYKSEQHNFRNIYRCLQDTLNLTDEETARMFEKCTSLMSKSTTLKITNITSLLKRLIVWDKESRVYKRLFNDEEVFSILKANPSLLSSSENKIKDSLSFIAKKVHNILLRQNVKDSDFLVEKQKFVKKLLMGNSSLLLIDTVKIKNGEWFVRNNLKENISENYYKVLCELYNEPKFFATLNDLKYLDLYNNAEKNINCLEKFVGKELTENYIKENPYFLVMKNNDFEFLLTSIAKIDRENENKELMQKFLFMGKSLFGKNYKFKVDDVIDRLKEGKCRKKIEIDLKDDAQCFKKFVKLFVEDNSRQEELLVRANNLVDFGEIYNRKNNIFEKDLKTTENQLEMLNQIMQNGNVRFKRDYINCVTKNVTHLIESMFSIFNATNFEEIKLNEKEKISETKNYIEEISEIYNSKRSKLSKLYSGVDDLYDRAMKFLSDNLKEIVCEKPLYEKFNSRIKDVYVKQVTDVFNTEPTAQCNMLTNNIDVQVDENLVTAFNSLQKCFEKTYEMGDIGLNFQK